jgi:hypothetical protein
MYEGCSSLVVPSTRRFSSVSKRNKNCVALKPPIQAISSGHKLDSASVLHIN